MTAALFRHHQDELPINKHTGERYNPHQMPDNSMRQAFACSPSARRETLQRRKEHLVNLSGMKLKIKKTHASKSPRRMNGVISAAQAKQTAIRTKTNGSTPVRIRPRQMIPDDFMQYYEHEVHLFQVEEL